jgi:hypothetical protein
MTWDAHISIQMTTVWIEKQPFSMNFGYNQRISHLKASSFWEVCLSEEKTDNNIA